MFFWILNAFLSSLSQIFRKKSISWDKDISSTLIYFLWCFTYLWIAIYFLFFGNNYVELDKKIFILALAVIILGLLRNYLNQLVYKSEKISVLTPYTNLNKVLTIIFSFLFLKDDISILSFLITIFTSLVIIWSAIDFKNLSMSKNIRLFILNQFLTAIYSIIIWYILLLISSINYFIIDSTLSIFISFLIVLYFKELKTIKTLSKWFYKNAFISSMLGALAYLFSLILISELGMVMNILISFIFLAFSLLFSYIFFQDKPQKKDIILSIIILGLVSLGVFYR